MNYVLGSFLLSILSGHKCYAHIATLTGDGVNSKLLSMKKVVRSRPLLMSAIGKLTESGRQKKITITSQHNLMEKIQEMQTNLCVFF